MHCTRFTGRVKQETELLSVIMRILDLDFPSQILVICVSIFYVYVMPSSLLIRRLVNQGTVGNSFSLSLSGSAMKLAASGWEISLLLARSRDFCLLSAIGHQTMSSPDSIGDSCAISRKVVLYVA